MLLYIYCLMGPVVSKHGNLGPVVRARGAVSPTDRLINTIYLFRARVQMDHEHGIGMGRVDMERDPDSV